MLLVFEKGLLRDSTCVFLIALSYLIPTLAQSKPTDTADKTPPGSISLKTTTVSDCIKVEAVLLPRDPASKLFSGFVAHNYAVVKTTISNHCDNQQFILHDIYFDYSDWALSGVYKGPEPKAGCPTNPVLSQTASCSAQECAKAPSTPDQANDCCEKSDTACNTDTFTQGTKPGQVATVGALDIQDQVTEDSIFSKRNLVINGLTLVGQVAGGYAFVGSAAAAQGIGAFGSAFVPNLGKFWPDRRPDQEQFLLKLGYRTDQSTAIAKDDHGSYYAFFPLSTFLTPDLKKLFLSDPAVFLNPAEAWLAPGAFTENSQSKPEKHYRRENLAELRNFMWQLAQAAHGKDANFTPQKLLLDLTAKCRKDSCPICGKEVQTCPSTIQAEKDLFQKASLNVVKIVVRGVMTVDLDDVPPIVNSIAFDGEKSGASSWTVTDPPSSAAGSNSSSTAAGSLATTDSSAKSTVKVLSGTATGKFLSNATLAVLSVDGPPAKPDGTLSDLTASVDKPSTKMDNSHSSDITLAFSIGILKTLPSGTQITFQASRTTPNISNGTFVQATSSKYVYKVSYDAPAVQGSPSTSNVTIDRDTASVWATPGKLTGTVTGANLTGGTVSVSALTVAGKTAKVEDYFGTPASVPATSDAGKLEFQMPLLKAVPAGSKLSFIVSTKVGDKTTPTTPHDYIVPQTNAAPAKPGAKKPATTTKK